MGANLFKTGCKSCVGPIAQDELDCLGIDYTITECTAENVATCGQSFSELLELYPVFNLNLSLNENGRLFEFMDRVLFIENDGFSVTLRQAKTEILDFVQAVSHSDWAVICSIKLDKKYDPVTLFDLLSRYKLYRPNFYTKNWSELLVSWADLPDKWRQVSYRRDLVYSPGDSFTVIGPCQETICLYLVVKDFLATDENITKYSSFTSKSEYWVKIFCIETGFNSCLGYTRKNHPADLYEVVNIGSDCHKVERPVKYVSTPSLLNNIA